MAGSKNQKSEIINHQSSFDRAWLEIGMEMFIHGAGGTLGSLPG
jgi:hypothetical protein